MIGKRLLSILGAFAVLFLVMTMVIAPNVSAQESIQRVAAPSIEIMDLRVISWKPPLYHGWPTLMRRKSGELWLVFSGGRERHVCPFGRLEAMRSKDNGLHWGWPQVLYDGPSDDRDAGAVETAKGTLLVTNFTSLAYEPILNKAMLAKPGEKGAFADPKLLPEWIAAHERLGPDQRQSELGSYMIRSTDGGLNWSARYAVPLNSPHGPIVLGNGDLLYAGKALWKGDRIGFCLSTDDGLSWDWISDLPIRPGDEAKNYHELHAVNAGDDTIVCHIRNENLTNNKETLQSVSKDYGRTWSVPEPIGVWGLPSHLLKLKNNRLLMTYGHRRKPIGNQARVSDDNGKSWSEPILLSSDGSAGDLGYPSSIECDDGTMVTVWYEATVASPLAQLRQVRWRWK